MTMASSQHLHPGFNGDVEDGVGPLLARANLLRMRGQWDEAIAACAEALRRVPNSPSACSLLGDIYEAQHKFDEALQWYGMAVEFDPTNVRDRARLEQVATLHQRAARRQERDSLAAAAAAPRGLNHAAPPVDDVGSRTLRWFDRLFPPGRWETAARLILFLSGALALVLLFAAGFVYLSGGAGEDDHEIGEDGMFAGPSAVRRVVVPPPAPPRATVPPPAAAPGGTRVAPVGTGSAAAVGAASDRSAGLSAANEASRPTGTASTGSSGVPPPNRNGIGDENSDPELLAALRRALPLHRVAVTSAQVDPGATQIALALMLPADVASGGKAAAVLLFGSGCCVRLPVRCALPGSSARRSRAQPCACPPETTRPRRRWCFRPKPPQPRFGPSTRSLCPSTCSMACSRVPGGRRNRSRDEDRAGISVAAGSAD
jgi:hypothetical protein